MGNEYTSVLPLGNPGDYTDDERLKGTQLRMGDDGRAELASDVAKPSVSHASLVGPAPTFSTPKGMQGTMQAPHPHTGVQQPAQPVQRRMSPQELTDMANQMLDNQSAQHKAMLEAGSSVGQRDDSGGKIPDWLVNEMKKDEQL